MLCLVNRSAMIMFVQCIITGRVEQSIHLVSETMYGLILIPDYYHGDWWVGSGPME